MSHRTKITPALREEIRREGRRLIAEGRGLIVTRRLLCGAFGISRRDFDLLLCAEGADSCPTRRRCSVMGASPLPLLRLASGVAPHPRRCAKECECGNRCHAGLPSATCPTGPTAPASSRRSASRGSTGSIPSIHSAPVFPNHVDLVIALEQFFGTSNHNQNKE